MIFRTSFALILLFFLAMSALGQSFASKEAHNAMYIEALGMGGYGSVNFERRIFNKKKIHIGVRLGVGTYRLKDFETNFNPDITVPLALNMYYGRTHYLELGIGQTFTSVVKASTVDFAVARDNALSSNFNVGYRYQKKTKGLILRLNYNPIISSHSAFKHWYGLSVGYAF